MERLIVAIVILALLFVGFVCGYAIGASQEKAKLTDKYRYISLAYDRAEVMIHRLQEKIKNDKSDMGTLMMFGKAGSC